MKELQQLIATDLKGALKYCESLPAEKQAAAYHILFTRWTQQDPEAAFNAIQELPEQLRPNLMTQTLNQWATTNPQAALARLATADTIPAEARTQIALRMISAIGMRDPVAAINALSDMQLQDASKQAGVMAQILGRWIATDKATALAWLKDSDVDEATYDHAIVSAIGQMAHMGDPTKDAAALFREFVEIGRMDSISDPTVRAQATYTAKLLGATLGGKDYSTALQWGFELPPGSSSQAYVLSNVAFSQTHGNALPDMPWIASMEPGFARTRTVTAVAYGRLLAHGNADFSKAIRKQLDSDEYDLAGTRAMVEQTELPDDEKRALLSLL